MDHPGDRDRPPRLLSQLRESEDPELLIARLTIENMQKTDPALAAAYAAAALPRRFDREVVDLLVAATVPDAEYTRVFERLLQLSEVRGRQDGYFALHDSVRAPLLRHWRSGPDKALFTKLHKELAAHFREKHDVAGAAEEQLALCRPVLSEVNWERYVQLSRVVERQLTWPLADAIYHATASSPSDALLDLVEDFNENQSAGRLTTCSALVDSFFDAVMEFVDNPEQQRLCQWATYFHVRVFLSLDDFAGSEVVLNSLEREGIVDPTLRIWVIDELAAAARGQFQLDRALELRVRAVQERRNGDVDLDNLAVALGDLGRSHLDLWDESSARATYDDALRRAVDKGNSGAALNILCELAPTLARNGRAVDAADALLQLLHLARSAPGRVQGAHRLAATAIDVFVVLDYRQAETAYQEALLLFPAGTSRARLLDFDKDYLGSLAGADLVARAGELEEGLRRGLDVSSSQVKARTLLAMARAALARDELLRTLELVREVLELHREATVEPWQCAAARTDAGLACLGLGRLDEAEEFLASATDDWRGMGHRRGQALVAIYQAELAAHRGDLRKAGELLRVGDVFAGEGGVTESEYQRVCAALENRHGRWKESARRARSAFEIALAGGRLKSSGDVLAQLAILCGRAGDYGGARSAADNLKAVVDQVAKRAIWLPSTEEQAADRANAHAIAAIATQSSKRTAVLETAARQLRDAMDADPGPFWYPLNLAYLELELGNQDQVGVALEEARVRAGGGPFVGPIARLTTRLLN